MHKGLRAAAAAAAAITAVTMAAATAQAAPQPGSLGAATLAPATGQDVTSPQVVTSAGCPATADGYNVYVSGPGKFATPFLITTTQSVNFSTTAGFPIQFGFSMADAAKDLSTTLTAGEYDVTVNCLDTFTLAVKGTFTTAMYFTDATHYQGNDPNGPTTTTTKTTTTTTSPATTTSATTTTGTSQSSSTSTTVGSTTESATTTFVPQPSPAADQTGGQGLSVKLANTGVSIWVPLAAGLALLVLGAVGVVIGRRRRAARRQGE